MHIDARRDAMDVRVGPSFLPRDAERIHEAVTALGPFSRLTIDFGATRACDDAALVLLATRLRARSPGLIALRGLTQHQWRLLTYLGLHPEQRRPAPAAEALDA